MHDAIANTRVLLCYSLHCTLVERPPFSFIYFFLFVSSINHIKHRQHCAILSNCETIWHLPMAMQCTCHTFLCTSLFVTLEPSLKPIKNLQTRCHHP